MVKEIYHVVIPAEAKRQVKFISDYIARDNPDRAASFGRELIEKAMSLGLAPFSGSHYSKSKEAGLRFVTHGKGSKYIVIYKVIEDKKQIQIRAFWHGSRMPPNL